MKLPNLKELDAKLKEFESGLDQWRDIGERIARLTGQRRSPRGPKSTAAAAALVARAQAQQASARNGHLDALSSAMARVFEAMPLGEGLSAADIAKRAGYGSDVSAYNALHKLKGMQLVRHRGDRTWERIGTLPASEAPARDPAAVLAKLDSRKRRGALRVLKVLTDQPQPARAIAQAAGYGAKTHIYTQLGVLVKFNLATQKGNQWSRRA